MNNKISPELSMQAQKIAQATQKPGQSKAQTKLITQGIEKGIAEYKKQQNKKLRELDKKRKQQQIAKQQEMANQRVPETKKPNHLLPWILLASSWLGFILYIGFVQLY